MKRKEKEITIILKVIEHTHPKKEKNTKILTKEKPTTTLKRARKEAKQIILRNKKTKDIKMPCIKKVNKNI